MVRVLMTVLASLSIPAIALGVIAAIERRRQDPHDGMPNLPEDAIAPPEFEVSAQSRIVADAVPEEPRYRERAG
jgi:hypothetical protein